MCSGHGKRILSVEFFWVGVMRSGEVANPQASDSRYLLLGTVSFTVCFARWGLLAHLLRILPGCGTSATQTAFSGGGSRSAWLSLLVFQWEC